MRDMFVKNVCCYILSAILCFFLLYPGYVESNQEVVRVIEAEGISIVYGKDELSAREEAIRDSMRGAVEQVVEMLIPEEVVSENVDILDVAVYSKHQDYIRDYRILQEGIKNGRYRIRMLATLSLLDIRRDLEFLGIFAGRWQVSSARTIISVTVRGIERCRDFKVLREVLENDTRGVHAVSLPRIGSGVAQLDIEMQGDASVLAKELQLTGFRDFSLALIRMTHDTLEFNME